MNSVKTINIMTELRSGTKCPSCTSILPKHEGDCSFVDFHILEILVELYTNPNLDNGEVKTKLYEFIKERSGRDYFLDAVIYHLTTEILMKELSLYQSDYAYVTASSGWSYTWYRVRNLFRHRSFFRTKTDAQIITATKAVKVLDFTRDIIRSLLGTYTSTFNHNTQINALYLMTYWIEKYYL